MHRSCACVDSMIIHMMHTSVCFGFNNLSSCSLTSEGIGPGTAWCDQGQRCEVRSGEARLCVRGSWRSAATILGKGPVQDTECFAASRAQCLRAVHETALERPVPLSVVSWMCLSPVFLSKQTSPNKFKVSYKGAAANFR